MLKKINNYHLFFLILIVFILNTMLFKTINTIKAQGNEPTSGWVGPEGRPGTVPTKRILTSPMRTDLDLGGFDIIGEGNINIDGNINASGDITMNGNPLFETFNPVFSPLSGAVTNQIEDSADWYVFTIDGNKLINIEINGPYLHKRMFVLVVPEVWKGHNRNIRILLIVKQK